MGTRIKTVIVVVGAIAFSTLAINASDVLRGIEGSLPGLAIESTGPCDANAILLQFGGRGLCVDTYEAAPSNTCPHQATNNELETKNNLAEAACVIESKPNALPWRFVTLTQAQQMCARSGKRLPTNEEWYKAVSGMTDISMCHTNTRGSSPEKTGTAECVTPAGIQDMVGNVWEWIDEQVTDGVFDGRSLPQDGYVALVDVAGVVLETANTPQAEFGEDYAWTSSSGVRGMIRGGFYGSGTDAGIFTLNAAVPLDFRTTGVGFRCVKDI